MKRSMGENETCIYSILIRFSYNAVQETAKTPCHVVLTVGYTLAMMVHAFRTDMCAMEKQIARKNLCVVYKCWKDSMGGLATLGLVWVR